MLPKTYSSKDIELKFYHRWETSGAFQPSGKGNPFTIMMPPPNVTGVLHLGHALNNTLQDILIRFRRMQGHKTLWQPGVDHAGIATQMVVEKQLAAENQSRHDLGREKFLEKVWEWKESSGGQIVNQQKRLGGSADWSRHRFTMDDGMSQAVQKVFVDLYREGYIYKDKRLVNWDPKFRTAVSDLEVQNIEKNGTLWYFKYPIQASVDAKPEGYMRIATTRPETVFGDTGIAVHPEDKRYQHLVGKTVCHPLTQKLIPIVADEYSDPEKGTGAVKVTPAHDFNDFEVGQRHQLDVLDILDDQAILNQNVPIAYQGLDRFAARKKVVQHMKDLGAYDGEEATVHQVPHGEKTGVILEPRLTDQWFLDAEKLAGPALKMVENGTTQFVPKFYENTYFNWLKNIQPWCISRQLWWGHRIPVWYGPDDHAFAALTAEEAKDQAAKHYGKAVELRQETDVLDTWFSSALWPFATLNWPENNEQLDAFYPTDVLITAPDIIFFWVARMMMMGLKFMGKVPFHTVYIHAMVRDEKGEKMSKTKGNVIDPLEIMDTYGADPLRFTLAALSVPGRHIHFSKSMIEGYRNFATKIWNASRYAFQNGVEYSPQFSIDQCQNSLNKWIGIETKKAIQNITQHLDAYRIDEACKDIYQFTWGTFCDWYLEFTKPILQATSHKDRQETEQTIAWVLAQIYHCLHPFMPYVTEELWEHLTEGKAGLLMTSNWPCFETDVSEDENEDVQEIRWLIDLISGVRSLRKDLNIPPGMVTPLGGGAHLRQRLEKFKDPIRLLARCDIREEKVQSCTVQEIIGQETYWLGLTEDYDLQAEVKRREDSLEKAGKEKNKLYGMLQNKDFTNRAPQEVIEKNKLRLKELEDFMAKQNELLNKIKGDSETNEH